MRSQEKPVRAGGTKKQGREYQFLRTELAESAIAGACSLSATEICFLTPITQPLHGKADLLNARICSITELFFHNLSNKSTKFLSCRTLHHLMCLEYN